MRTGKGARSALASRGAVAVLVFLTVAMAPAAAASASSWTITLTAGSTGATTSGNLAAPPAPTTACPSGNGSKTTVTVTWTSVAHASSYTVLESTTSATSGYTSVAGGQTGSSWTSGNLGAGTYWFEVQAVDGSWSSASTAGAQRTIGNNSCS